MRSIEVVLGFGKGSGGRTRRLRTRGILWSFVAVCAKCERLGQVARK